MHISIKIFILPPLHFIIFYGNSLVYLYIFIELYKLESYIIKSYSDCMWLKKLNISKITFFLQSNITIYNAFQSIDSRIDFPNNNKASRYNVIKTYHMYGAVYPPIRLFAISSAEF